MRLQKNLVSKCKKMKFEFSPHAQKKIRKFDQKIIKSIFQKLTYYEKTGDILKYCEKIAGSNDLYKYRIGNYRIITYPNFEKNAVIILEIGHRGNIYESLKKF